MDRKFKVLKIDHVAIAVHDIFESLSLFETLGMVISNSEVVKNEKVNVVKIKAENKGHTLELLEPIDSSSVVRKFLNNNNEGLHHIALQVDNIFEAIKYLRSKNISLIYNTPKIGADKKLITFIHPKSTPGILLELCQSQ